MLEELNSSLLGGFPQAFIMGAALGVFARELENTFFFIIMQYYCRRGKMLPVNSLTTVQPQSPTVLAGHTMLSPEEAQLKPNVSKGCVSVSLGHLRAT